VKVLEFPYQPKIKPSLLQLILYFLVTFYKYRQVRYLQWWLHTICTYLVHV